MRKQREKKSIEILQGNCPEIKNSINLVPSTMKNQKQRPTETQTHSENLNSTRGREGGGGHI